MSSKSSLYQSNEMLLMCFCRAGGAAVEMMGRLCGTDLRHAGNEWMDVFFKHNDDMMSHVLWNSVMCMCS